MFQIHDHNRLLCDGLTRREWLRIGGTALGGLSLADLLAGRTMASAGGRTGQPSARLGKAKSVIVVGLLGGPPQHDTWDPKPKAPVEVRGPYGIIPTRTPGLFVGELMPRTAQLTDKIAVLRAVSTNDNAHSSSGYQMLTGVPHIPLNQESATPKAPNNEPTMGAIIRALHPDAGRLPSAVTLPEHIWNTGNFPWPGQDAGLLGPRYNPWLLHCDPSQSSFQVPALMLPPEVPPLRFDARKTLLEQVNHHFDDMHRSGFPDAFSPNAQKAIELLNGAAARKAFDLQQEPDSVRERYGRSRFAQSVLLARRLIEAGVCFVQINWTRIKDHPNDGGWDTHEKHNQSLKSFLMPMMDQVYSALLEDLEIRGLLDETLVVWFGEFGRTPRFNGAAGRDHWGHCFSLALAGGGIRGGVVHGTSDKNAAYPIDGRVEGRDLIATLYHCLGHDPDTTVRDSLGRPIPISRGKVIQAIL
jgi:Protein of unknown function (DUF1501)